MPLISRIFKLISPKPNVRFFIQRDEVVDKPKHALNMKPMKMHNLCDIFSVNLRIGFDCARILIVTIAHRRRSPNFSPAERID